MATRFPNTNINIIGNFKTSPMDNKHQSAGPEQLANWEAAGIIPYDFDSQNSWFLLGFDPHHGQNQWKYFGGGRESQDQNPRQTALRETIEETCLESNWNSCHLPLKSVINPALTQGNGFCIPKFHQQTGQWNNFYFIKINKNTWISSHNSQSDIPVSGIKNQEVSRIKWFSDWDIFDAICYQSAGQISPLGKIHPPLMAIMRDHQIYNLVQKN